MMYLPRVATVTLRALNGVSQLVLICASTPEAVRNCSSAISSRSATALESCGCTSTISDSVNQRIRSISCTARSLTTPTLHLRGGNRAEAGYADGENVFAGYRLLDRGNRRVEAFDVADHQRHTGLPRRGDDVVALLDRGGDGLLDQDVDVARDAGERDLVMQMGR